MESFYFWTTFAVFAALGLAVGSFLNVVVYRLPRGMNLAKPASHCTSCGRKLAWRDNIPVFSYLFSEGKMPLLRRARIPALYRCGNGELRALVHCRACVLPAGRDLYGVLRPVAFRPARHGVYRRRKHVHSRQSADRARAVRPRRALFRPRRGVGRKAPRRGASGGSFCFSICCLFRCSGGKGWASAT